MPREEHAARNWVEKNYPFWDGYLKAALILAYGAGLDRGLAEAQEIVAGHMAGWEEKIIADVLGKMREQEEARDGVG